MANKHCRRELNLDSKLRLQKVKLEFTTLHRNTFLCHNYNNQHITYNAAIALYNIPLNYREMANLLNNNSKAQLAATALISGAVVASTIFGYQAVRRQVKVEILKRDIPELGASHQGDKVGVFICGFLGEGVRGGGIIGGSIWKNS